MTNQEALRNLTRIHVDREHFDVPGESITGAELRALPDPDVPADRAIWKVVPGPADDIPVEDGDAVPIKNGDRFFTAPKVIAPGAANAAR